MVASNRNGENELQQEHTEVVLVKCNIVNNQYQHDSRVLCTFVPNKSFGQQLNIPPIYHTCPETFHSEFTDQNSLSLEIDSKNLTLVIDDKGI